MLAAVLFIIDPLYLFTSGEVNIDVSIMPL